MRETAGQIPPRLSAEPSENSEQPLGELGNPDPISTSCDFKRSLWLAGRFASLRFASLCFTSPLSPLPRPPRRHLPEGSALTTAGPGGLCPAAGRGRGASRRLTGGRIAIRVPVLIPIPAPGAAGLRAAPPRPLAARSCSCAAAQAGAARGRARLAEAEKLEMQPEPVP